MTDSPRVLAPGSVRTIRPFAVPAAAAPPLQTNRRGIVLSDGDALGVGKAFFRLGATAHSPDHRLLAWSADETGAELFTIRVRDLARMAELRDVVPETAGDVVWTRDCSAFYYVRLDAQHRPSSVHRHRLGADVRDDIEVYAVADGARFVSLSRLQCGRSPAICVPE